MELVFCIFAACGVALAASIFGTAPILGLVQATIAASVSAALAGFSWWAFCLRARLYSTWRWLCCGVAAGVICHPLFWLISAGASGNLDFLPFLWLGSLFSLFVAGVYTFPAGILAAAICRTLVAPKAT
jgi:hypothetical protein